MKGLFKKGIAWYLVFAMLVISFVPRADAGLAPSEAIQLAAADRDADLSKIRQALEMKAVSERLKQLGYSSEEIQQRLASLSDQQIHRIAVQLDDLKVGGDGLGVIIAVLVIIVLVIVILKLTGHQVIVTR